MQIGGIEVKGEIPELLEELLDRIESLEEHVEFLAGMIYNYGLVSPASPEEITKLKEIARWKNGKV